MSSSGDASALHRLTAQLSRPLSLSVVLLFALFVLYFIWPGQWRFDNYGDTPMRTHRITGRSELFLGGEWARLDDKPAVSSDTTRMLSDFESLLVTGRGGVGRLGYFEGSLYNGSVCVVTRAVYQITTARGADTTSRTFSETEYVPSRQTKNIIFKVDAADDLRTFVRWAVDSLEGTCPKNAALK